MCNLIKPTSKQTLAQSHAHSLCTEIACTRGTPNLNLCPAKDCMPKTDMSRTLYLQNAVPLTPQVPKSQNKHTDKPSDYWVQVHSMPHTAWMSCWHKGHGTDMALTAISCTTLHGWSPTPPRQVPTNSQQHSVGLDATQFTTQN